MDEALESRRLGFGSLSVFCLVWLQSVQAVMVSGPAKEMQIMKEEKVKEVVIVVVVVVDGTRRSGLASFSVSCCVWLQFVSGRDHVWSSEGNVNNKRRGGCSGCGCCCWLGIRKFGLGSFSVFFVFVLLQSIPGCHRVWSGVRKSNNNRRGMEVLMLVAAVCWTCE